MTTTLGADVHFTILSNAKDILKIIRTMCLRANNFNNLEKVEDSVQLLYALFQMKKVTRVMPHKMTYPDPKAPEAKRPKIIQAVPAEQQSIGPTGMYMWVNKDSGWKQYIYLGLAVFAAFFILLFKVWPEWLRLAVWYVSWYLLVFLVSSGPINSLDWCGCRQSNCLVLSIPRWH